MTANETEVLSRIETFRLGWDLMAKHERWQTVVLSIVVCLGGVFDMIVVSAIMPFLGLLIAPESWGSKPAMAWLLSLFNNPPIAVLIPAAGIAIGVAIVMSAAGNYWIRRAINRFSAQCRKRLAGELATFVVKAPYAWHVERNPAILARQINADVMKWGNDFVGRILSVGQSLGLVMLALGLIIGFAPLTGLAAVSITAGISLVLVQLLKGRLLRYAQGERDALDPTSVSAYQLMVAIKDVKISANPIHFVDLYRDGFNTISDIQAARNTVRQSMPIIMMLIAQTVLVVFAVSLWVNEIKGGEIVEQVAFIALVASRLIPAINRLMADATVFWDVFPYVQSIHQFRSTLEVVDDSHEPAAGGVVDKDRSRRPGAHVVLKDIEFSYPTGDKLSVHNLSFEFEPGKAYGVAGKSGAGKTTLVDLLLGLFQPTKGQIFANGRLLDPSTVSEWHQRVSYVPQQPYLIDNNLRSNVAFGVSNDKQDVNLIRECLAMANLAFLENELPQGLDTRLGDRGVRLSGGQRQRVALARALYKRPELLVLDEATSALDSPNEKLVQDALKNLYGHLTIVTIAHRISTIRDSDAILLMDSGRLVSCGSYDELLRTSSLFRRLVAGGVTVLEGENLSAAT